MGNYRYNRAAVVLGRAESSLSWTREASVEREREILLHGLSEQRFGESDSWLQVAIFLFPLALTSLFVGMKIWWPHQYTQAIQEDGILEYTQAVAYLIAALVALSMAVVFWRSGHSSYAALYSVLALALLLVSGEEISWGQRIFHFSSPEYFQRENVQGELTIHNLNPIQKWLHSAYMIVGFVLAFSWLFVTGRLRQRYPLAATFLVPGWFLTFYFLPVGLLYCYFDHLSVLAVRLGCASCKFGEIVFWGDQEPAEFLLALGILLFVTINRRRLSRQCLVPGRLSSHAVSSGR